MSGWSPWTKELMEVSDCCGTGTFRKGGLLTVLDKSEALQLLHSMTERRSRWCNLPWEAPVVLAVDVLIENFLFQELPSVFPAGLKTFW